MGLHSLKNLFTQFSRSASCAHKLRIIFIDNFCALHQWRARTAMWSFLVYGIDSALIDWGLLLSWNVHKILEKNHL